MLSWFRTRRRSELSRDIARQLEANDTSTSEAEKMSELQRRLEEKRAALGLA
jgi:hypothetical protein